MPKAKPAPKKPVKAPARSSTSTKKAPVKKAVVGSGSKKKQGFFASLTKRNWIMIGLVLVAIFGGIGVWKLVASNAYTTALNSEQCMNRGRVYSSSACQSSCINNSTQGYAGSYITSGVTYAYCSNANSTGISSSTCASLNRDYNTGSNGCSREWRGTYGSKYTNDIHCRYNNYTYVNASSSTAYDKCVAPTTTTTTTTSTSAYVKPVAGSYTLTAGYKYWLASIGKYHVGQDFANPNGGTVVAAHAGKIVHIDYNGSTQSGLDGCRYSVMQTVTGDSSKYLVYQHMSSLSSGIYTGATVSANQSIGPMGAPYGNCGGGTHLHFEIQRSSYGTTFWGPNRLNETMDPCPIIPGC